MPAPESTRLSDLDEIQAPEELRLPIAAYGMLTAKALLTMLAEDAAMTISRPSSWEGANMATVESHGYRF